jgi:hypothetical protein
MIVCDSNYEKKMVYFLPLDGFKNIYDNNKK